MPFKQYPYCSSSSTKGSSSTWARPHVLRHRNYILFWKIYVYSVRQAKRRSPGPLPPPVWLWARSTCRTQVSERATKASLVGKQWLRHSHFVSGDAGYFDQNFCFSCRIDSDSFFGPNRSAVFTSHVNISHRPADTMVRSYQHTHVPFRRRCVFLWLMIANIHDQITET